MQQNKKSPQYLVASVKDADSKKGIVTGYAAAFNNLDSDNDIIMPGAFTKTISERGPKSSKPRIKYLLDHNTSKALGVLLSLTEDNHGLAYEAQVGTHTLGLDFVKMVESGLITEHSIGYSTVQKTIINAEADWRDQQTQLKELTLWELSPLQTWGANEMTPLLGMKSQKELHDRMELLIKAVRTGKFTEKTFDILEKELLILQAQLKSDYETTEPDDKSHTTQPNDEDLILILANANMRMQLFTN